MQQTGSGKAVLKMSKWGHERPSVTLDQALRHLTTWSKDTNIREPGLPARWSTNSRAEGKNFYLYAQPPDHTHHQSQQWVEVYGGRKRKKELGTGREHPKRCCPLP